MNTNAIIFVLMIIAFSLVVLALPHLNFNSATSSENNKMVFDDYVHIVAFSPSTNKILLDEWRKNLVTNNALDELKYVLGGTHYNINATWIALGNSSNGSPLPADTKLSGELVGCGLTNATGTYVSVGTGAWNVTKTFTSTCAGQVVNSTALYNSSVGGTGGIITPALAPLLFAEANFTQTTLQSNDQINVTWGVQITTSG